MSEVEMLYRVTRWLICLRYGGMVGWIMAKVEAADGDTSTVTPVAMVCKCKSVR
jgi:hypothetical protein